jgi:hypothetical protein
MGQYNNEDSQTLLENSKVLLPDMLCPGNSKVQEEEEDQRIYREKTWKRI